MTKCISLGVLLCMGMTGCTVAADGNGIGAGDDGFRKGSEHGIVLEQVRESLGVGKIVHRHEFNVGTVKGRADDVPADAAEAINANLDCHVFS